MISDLQQNLEDLPKAYSRERQKTKFINFGNRMNCSRRCQKQKEPYSIVIPAERNGCSSHGDLLTDFAGYFNQISPYGRV
jgi:hypothetical protein